MIESCVFGVTEAILAPILPMADAHFK